MAISVGDKLPDANLFIMTDEGPAAKTMADFVSGRKVVLFAVPGAFTPTCHVNHAPGFVMEADAFKAKGVDEIACIGVNDVFVLSAWQEQLNAAGKVTMLADGNAEFTKAVGLELDASAFGLGVRSKRYAMLVNDGEVVHLSVEDDPTEANASSAANLLEAL